MKICNSAHALQGPSLVKYHVLSLSMLYAEHNMLRHIPNATETADAYGTFASLPLHPMLRVCGVTEHSTSVQL